MNKFRFTAVLALALLCIILAVSSVLAGSTQSCQMRSSNVRCFDAQVAGRGYGAKTLSADVLKRKRKFGWRAPYVPPAQFRQRSKRFARFAEEQAAVYQPRPLRRGRRSKSRAPSTAPAGGAPARRKRRRRRRGFFRRIGRALRRIGRAFGRLFRRKKKRPVCLNPQTRQPVLCGQPTEITCTYKCEDKFLRDNEICTCPQGISPEVTLSFFQVARPVVAPNSCPVSTELGVIPLSDARDIVKGVVALCAKKNCYCDEKGIGLQKLSRSIKQEIQRSGLENPPDTPGRQRRKKLV